MTNPNQFLPVPEIKYAKKSAILGEFTVSVHSSLMDDKMKSAFASLQKRVSLPGFRPGKVPLDMVKKKYHEDVLHDVFRSLVTESYRKGAVENKVPVAGEPFVTKTNLNEWKEGESLSFTAQVDLIPEVELKKYKGLPVTKKEARMQKDDVEIVLKNLLEPKAELVNLDADTKLTKEHLAVIDFAGTLDGEPLADATATNFFLEMGGKNAVEDFEKGIVGMKAGETRQVKVKYPDDFKAPQIAGKTVHYEVKVHEIKKKNYPELTDELAKEFQAGSAAELRARIQKSLDDEMAAEQLQHTQDEVLLALLEQNPFDVPPSLVERQLQYILNDVHNLLKRQQFGDQLINEYFQKHGESFKNRAEREVKIALLMPKVVEAEKIKVSDADFKKHFEELAKQTGQQLDAIEKFYNENSQRKNELSHELERRKALQVMVDSAKVK